MHEYAFKKCLILEENSDGFNKFKWELFSKRLFADKRVYLSVMCASQTLPFLQLFPFCKLRGYRLWMLPPTFTSRLSSKEFLSRQPLARLKAFHVSSQTLTSSPASSCDGLCCAEDKNEAGFFSVCINSLLQLCSSGRWNTLLIQKKNFYMKGTASSRLFKLN